MIDQYTGMLVSDEHENIALWENKICIVGKRTFPHDGNYDAQMFPTMYHLYACVYFPHNDQLGRTDSMRTPQCTFPTMYRWYV